jgi:tetratricopeptide (TPR) repeat protein
MKAASLNQAIQNHPMHQDSTVKLSLCMIVKDEAAMLPEFLKRVRGLWDELVVVDTGSTDNTVQLLEAEGARVLHKPWRQDFSDARNFSIETATGDWIIFLDPDEYVLPAFAGQARAVISNPRAGAASVLMQDLREDGHVQEARLIRMFRRYPDVHFRHAIHEDVAETLIPRLLTNGQAIVEIDSPIAHHGYRKEVAQERNKKQRDTAIIEATLQREPDDLYLHFKLLELARFWADESLARKSAPAAFAAWNRAPDSALNFWAGELAVMLVEGLHAGDLESALDLLEKFAQRIPHSPAVAYRKGELLELLNRLEEAKCAFEAAILKPGPAINIQLNGVRPRMGLVRTAIAMKNMQAARAHLQIAYQMAPNDPEVAFTMGLI